jgi:hypothetical protein
MKNMYILLSNLTKRFPPGAGHHAITCETGPNGEESLILHILRRLSPGGADWQIIKIPAEDFNRDPLDMEREIVELLGTLPKTEATSGSVGDPGFVMVDTGFVMAFDKKQ